MANNQPNNTHHADKLRRKWLQRKWLSWLWNKQTFIFLFFLVLSTTFWLFQALNETYEEDFAIPIELRNVPGNVVVTTDLPNVVHVSLRDKGSVLLAYRYTHKFKSIVVDFTTYSNNNGYGAVQTAEVMRQIATQLVGSTQIVSIKPDTLEFYYNYGLCKRVPVVMQGKVGAGRLFSLANMLLGQDSVTVYAAKELLDTITAAYTQPPQSAWADRHHTCQCAFYARARCQVCAQQGQCHLLCRPPCRKNSASARAAGQLPGVKTVAHLPRHGQCHLPGGHGPLPQHNERKLCAGGEL